MCNTTSCKRTWAFLFCFTVFGSILVGTAAGQAISADATQPESGRWYKGNLHTHSLWSDGNDFPEMICHWYKSQGYHFLALTDHNILSQGEKWIDAEMPLKRGAIEPLERYRNAMGADWVQTRTVDGKQQIRLKPLNEFRPLFDEAGKFLLIQGEEITDHFERLPIHVNATNLHDLISPQGGKSVRETMSKNLQAVQRQSERIGRPIFAHLNHPNFGYAITAEDMAHVQEEHFFEVYNGHPSVNHRGDARHADMEHMWDIANTIRLGELKQPPLSGIATDDAHNYFGNQGASVGRGWVMVRTNRLTPESIIHALERADFYASSGVVLKDVSFDESIGELRIEIDAQDGVQYETRFIGTRENYDRATKPVLDKDGNELAVTQSYSEDVGKLLSKTTDHVATYRLQGDELYVRAVVTSNQSPENPAFDGQFQQAWTQPVGWRKWLDKVDKAAEK